MTRPEELSWGMGCLSVARGDLERKGHKKEMRMDEGGQILIPLNCDSYPNVRNTHVVVNDAACSICLFTMPLKWFAPTKFVVKETLEV